MDEAPKKPEHPPSLRAVPGGQTGAEEDREIIRREKLLELRLKEMEVEKQSLEVDRRRLQLRVQEKQSDQVMRLRGRDHFWGITITLITLLSGIGFAALDKEIGFYLLGAGGTSGAITANSIKQSRSDDRGLEVSKTEE